MRKYLGLLLVMLTSSLWAEACPTFLEGVREYKAGHYQAATSEWDACVQQGVRNADLYYNLGNAEYRQGNLGRALWNYESALRLAPTDPDLNANAKFVRTQIVDKVDQGDEEENPVLKALWKVHHALSLNQQLAVILVMAWMAGLILMLVVWSRHVALRNALFGVLFALGVLASLLVLDTAFKAHTYETEQVGIILSRAADVMSGPGTQYQVLHELHEGTRVEVVEVQDNWVSIRIGDNVNGFVSLDELGLVK